MSDEYKRYMMRGNEDEKRRAQMAAFAKKEDQYRRRGVEGRETPKERQMRKAFMEDKIRKQYDVEKEETTRVMVKKGMPKDVTKSVRAFQGGPVRVANTWMQHVKKVRKDNPGMPYKELLQLASSSYNK